MTLRWDRNVNPILNCALCRVAQDAPMMLINTKGEYAMRKSAALLVAAMFAIGSVSAFAQDKKDAPKKPSAEECKKDPKLAGCEAKK